MANNLEERFPVKAVAGFTIRVVRMAKTLPYPIEVFLPPTELGKPNNVDISDAGDRGPKLLFVIPSGDERHTKLGAFLNEWSMLEVMLRDLLEKLLGSDIKTAKIVMSSLGMKQIIDLLSGLGSVRLSEDKNKSLTSLLERLGKLNTKRNTLVHGNWVLEGIVFVAKGEARLKTQFVRELLPADPTLAKQASNPINQKERVRYCFTIKRIDGVIKDIIALKTDFVQFTQNPQLFADAPAPE